MNHVVIEVTASTHLFTEVDAMKHVVEFATLMDSHLRVHGIGHSNSVTIASSRRVTITLSSPLPRINLVAQISGWLQLAHHLPAFKGAPYFGRPLDLVGSGVNRLRIIPVKAKMGGVQ